MVVALAVLVVGLPVISWSLRWVWWVLAGRRRGGSQPRLWWGRSLFVGQDNRVSTSKTTALVWTYSVAAAILSFLIARWLGHSEAYDALNTQGLSAQYAVLIGGPLGAAILAKAIVSAQVDSGSTAKPPADSPSPTQLVQNDSGQADLGDVQYLLFNVVALVFLYGELFRAPQAGMPSIPDVLVGLTSIAAVGFVGKKAISGGAVISDVKPSAARVGERVRITTTGLITSANDLPAVIVNFGDANGDEPPLTATTTTTQGVLLDATVPPDAAGEVAVTVSVPTGKSATWPGFTVIPEITPGQSLAGKVGQPIEVLTTGVIGLGDRLPGLIVTIGGRSAAAKLNANRNLEVTVPTDAPVSPNDEIVLRTPGGVTAPAPFDVTG